MRPRLFLRVPLLMVSLFLTHGVLKAELVFPVAINDPGNQFAGYHEEVVAAIQGAGAEWNEVFDTQGTISIEVLVNLGADVPRATGGSETSAFVRNDGTRNVFEQGAGAEIRTGVDPNGATADIVFDVGADYLQNELWFDPAPLDRNSPVPEDRTDAVSVFMHEFGHAFFFNGWIDWQTGSPPADFQSNFDALTVNVPEGLQFNGPRTVQVYGAGLPLTDGNVYHMGNAEGGAGDDLLPDVMNGVVYQRGDRYELSAHTLAIAEDLDLPVALNWERWSVLAFRERHAAVALAKTGDDDGDRRENYFEFATGTDPKNPRSGYRPLLVVDSEGEIAGEVNVRIEIPLIKAVRGVALQVDVSSPYQNSFSPQALYQPASASQPLQWINFEASNLSVYRWFARVQVVESAVISPPNLLTEPVRSRKGPVPIRQPSPESR